MRIYFVIPLFIQLYVINLTRISKNEIYKLDIYRIDSYNTNYIIGRSILIKMEIFLRWRAREHRKKRKP